MADPAIVLIGRNGLGGKRHPIHGTLDILHEIQVFALADHVANATIGKSICRGRYPDRIQEIGIALHIDGELRIEGSAEVDAKTSQVIAQPLAELQKGLTVKVYLPVIPDMVLPIDRQYELFPVHCHQCLPARLP